MFVMNESFYTNDNYFKNQQDNLSDYFFKTKIIKKLNNNFLITGPIIMYLYQIPTPIFLPFSYIYTDYKNYSKFLIPKIGIKNHDFYIENLGFFLSISKNWDFRVTGAFYNKNHWKINTKTRYNFQDKYSGNIDINYQNINNNNNYFKIKYNNIFNNKNYILNTNIKYINHNMSDKEKINIKHIINDSFYLNKYSISLKKKFSKFPLKFIIINNLIYDFHQKGITMYIPKLRLTIENIHPFKNKKNIFLKNFNINYNINIKNKFHYNYNFKKKIMQTQLKQNLLIYTTRDILKYFILTPIMKYNENILFIINKNYENIFFNNFTTFLKNRLQVFRSMKLEVNLFFPFFNLKTFRKNIFLKTLHHQIDTQIVYSYYPILINNNYHYLDLNKHIYQKINFLLSNKLKIKIKDKKNNYKKINLLDKLNIYTTYNISKKLWSDIIFNGNTTIKNFTFDISGRINKNNKNIFFLYKQISNINKDKIDVLKYFSINLGYRLYNNNKYANNIYNKKGEIRYENFFFDENNYAIYNFIWNLNLKLNYNYNNILYNKNIIDKNILLKLDGNIYITPFTRIGINMDYDIINRKINNTLFILDRDLRSFQIKFIWSTNNIWYFYLGINNIIFNN